MRWLYSKSTVDGRLSIDVNLWNRKRLLEPGISFQWNWSKNGQNTGSMVVKTYEDEVRLIYAAKEEKMDYSIDLTYTSCNYGGGRPWFLCPNWDCRKRVGKLYLAGSPKFLCRHCLELAYESQREKDCFRMLNKAQKIRERLGGSANMFEPFPPRPKGMHHKTYLRLWRESDEAWNMSLGAFDLGKLAR